VLPSRCKRHKPDPTLYVIFPSSSTPITRNLPFVQSRLIHNIQSDLFWPNTRQHHVKLIQDPRPCPLVPTARAAISISSIVSISMKILYTLKWLQASRKTPLSTLSLPRARGHRFILSTPFTLSISRSFQTVHSSFLFADARRASGPE
jgi:hypothetical protein